jgi:hypothetical protein
MAQLEQNVGFTDRYLRLSLGSLALAVGAARLARNPDLTGITLGLLGGMALADGVLGTCPFYSMMGVDTREEGRQFEDEAHTHDLIEPYERI